MKRNKITVEKINVGPLLTHGVRPFTFNAGGRIILTVTRTLVDGTTLRGYLSIHLYPGYKTDGASVPWPFSYLVPRWRPGDDEYNAAPTAHDVLYMLRGRVPVICSEEVINLSREEVDDILRGIWRCWGMSRFLAGAADKAVEILAGGEGHWGCDSYGVRDRVNVYWHPMAEEARWTWLNMPSAL